MSLLVFINNTILYIFLYVKSHREELVKTFPVLCRHLICWIEATEELRQCQDLLQDRHQQLALVKEAQAMGRNHALYSVVKRYNSFKRARDAHEKAKASLKEKIEECEKQINMHNVSFNIRALVN